MDPQLKARLAVTEFFNTEAGMNGVGELVDREPRNGDDPTHVNRAGDIVTEITVDDVYVVTFSYILQNWKALLSTTVMDDMVYELTYDTVKKRMYIDAYKKVLQDVIEDDPVAALREKLSGDAR